MTVLFKKARLKALTAAIAGMFAAPASPGIWLDNADWNTSWYQDAAGTTPITAMEQPLGLALSKDKGLAYGADLAVNGGFVSDLSGWTSSSSGTSTSTWVAGGLQLFSDASTYAGEWQGMPTVIGKWYRVDVDVTTPSGSLQCRVGTSGGAGDVLTPTTFMTTAGLKSVYFLAIGTTSYIQVRHGSGATAVVRSVKLRQIAGNHVFQATSGVRPVVSARYNGIVASESIESASWSKVGATAANAAVALPVGVSKAGLITVTGGAGYHYAYQDETVAAKPAGSVQSQVYWLKRGTTQWGWIGDGGDAVWHGITIDFDGVTISHQLNATGVILATDGTWFKVKITYTRTNAGVNRGGVAPSNASTNGAAPNYTAAGTETMYVTGADIRPADQFVYLPAYQATRSSTDYDGPDKGFPPYIALNGTQWMQHSAIDFSGVNKVMIVAGARKTAEPAVAGIIAELSSVSDTTNGTFAICFSSSSRFTAQARGTALGYFQPSVSAAPATMVVAAAIDTARASRLEQVKPRINGVLSQALGGGADPIGSTNFSNNAGYVGARGGTQYFLTGQISQLIIRGSTVAANDALIGNSEIYARIRSRAY